MAKTSMKVKQQNDKNHYDIGTQTNCRFSYFSYTLPLVHLFSYLFNVYILILIYCLLTCNCVIHQYFTPFFSILNMTSVKHMIIKNNMIDWAAALPNLKLKNASR